MIPYLGNCKYFCCERWGACIFSIPLLGTYPESSPGFLKSVPLVISFSTVRCQKQRAKHAGFRSSLQSMLSWVEWICPKSFQSWHQLPTCVPSLSTSQRGKLFLDRDEVHCILVETKATRQRGSRNTYSIFPAITPGVCLNIEREYDTWDSVPTSEQNPRFQGDINPLA